VKVTVITAVLNDRDGLARTRASVLAQRDVAIQHIVIDGGSSDGTLQLLTDWSQSDNFVFLSEPDSGVYQAFNKGLDLVSGDCVGFLNAGDVYQDESVLADLTTALGDSSVDLIFGDIDITRSDGVDETIRRYKSAGFAGKQLLRGFMPPHPSVYARKSVYQTVGSFREDFRIAGDFEWAIRAFLQHGIKARHLDRVFVRMPAGGMSNNGIASVLRNTSEMRRALAMNGHPASWFSLIMRLPLKWFHA